MYIETRGATDMNAANMFLPYDKFEINENFYFPIFHMHKNSQINHFNSIFKSGKFWGVTSSHAGTP